MKRQTKITAIFSLAVLLAVSAFADGSYSSDTNGMARNGCHLKEALKYSSLKGVAVVNQSNEKLGKIQDFAVDLKSGRIVAVSAKKSQRMKSLTLARFSACAKTGGQGVIRTRVDFRQ